MEFIFSHHALEEIRRRAIPLELVESVLQHPQQIVEGYGEKKVYQSWMDLDDGKLFLLWIIVRGDVDPPMVVTVYKTSKIDKYWRKS